MAGTAKSPIPSGDFGISQDQLVSMTKDHNYSAFEEYGGVELLKKSFSFGS